MSHSEIVKESGNLRAVIVLDESPSTPDWDGQAAVLTLYTKNWNDDVTARNAEAEPFQRVLTHFQDRFGHDNRRGYRDRVLKTFERYLRIFHDTKSFLVVEADYMETDYTYIAFDTAELRKEWGVNLDHLDAEAIANLAKGELDAWRAWGAGDVWGVRVERSTGYVKTWEDGSVEDGREWVTVADTDVWGYYGRDDAEETAIAALENEAGTE